MPRLLIQSGAQPGSEIELRPGVTRVGRLSDNDVQLDDASVSGHHCELIREAGDLRVRDLGSTNGTFVEGEPVQDAVVRPGQRLQLGQVELVYEPRAQVQAEPEAPPLPALPAGLSPCHDHPQQAAEWLCSRCHNLFCPACAAPRKLGAKTVRFCSRCGGQCVPFGLGPIQKPPEVKPSFFRALPGAFAYPLKSNGLIVILGGSVFFAFLEFLQGRAGLLSLFVTVILWGYLFAFLDNVITTSAGGTDSPPSWPEFGDWWSDIVSPLLRWIALILICLGPAQYFLGRASLEALGSGEWPGGTVVAGLSLGLAGMLYLPMALLAVAMADSIAGINPLVVIPSILRLPLQYATACVLLFVAMLLELLAEYVLVRLPIPILPSLVAWCLFLYVLLVEMRLLGLLYYSNKESLGWFRH